MEEEKKSRKKRKTSIITVFLWLFLIITMSVITIGSIRNQNAIENSIDKVTIKLDMSQIDDEILEAYALEIESNYFIGGYTESYKNIFPQFIQKENKVYTYELKEVPTENFILLMAYFDYYENGNLLQSEIQNSKFAYYKEVKVEELQSEYIFEARGEKLEVSIQNETEISPKILLSNQDLGNLFYFDEIVGCSELVNISNEDNVEKYIGIRTSQVKSIVISRSYDIYEQDTLLKTFNSGYYFKNLTESNEYYFNEKAKKGTIINIKMENMTDEEMETVINSHIDISFSQGLNIGYYVEDFDKIIDQEHHQIQIIFDYPVSERLLGIDIHDYFMYIPFLEKNDELIPYYEYFDLYGITQTGEYNEYNIVLKGISEKDVEGIDYNTYTTEQIKWIDKDTGKAEILLKNTSIMLGYETIYIHQLADDFVLSSEYESRSDWKIVDRVSSKVNKLGISIDVVNLFKEFTNLKYIYVKENNTIYWKSNISDFSYQSEPIYVYYKDYNKTSSIEKLIDISKYSIWHMDSYPLDFAVSGISLLEFSPDAYWSIFAQIKSPNLGFYHTEERNITVHKNGTDGIYYVGLFENDILSRVEKLEVIDGKGSIQINIENYEETKQYSICEVDEEGNKITNEAYPVRFSDDYDVRNAEISSNTKIVSSVKSGVLNVYSDKMQAPIEESTGTGEADYIDNMLFVADTYLADVTIGEEVEHKVTYEADEGGKLEGETEEYVKDGETPQNIPTPVPEEGYEFDKWVIVEDGEEIEVDPSTYVPTKDVTFIAKFKEIQKIVDVDTSDIQVWVYAGIAVIAVIGIIIVIFAIRKNRQKRK